MRAELLDHLQRKCLFEMLQSGFRTQPSPEKLNEVPTGLLRALDDGLVSVLVLLDLQKNIE